VSVEDVWLRSLTSSGVGLLVAEGDVDFRNVSFIGCLTIQGKGGAIAIQRGGAVLESVRLTGCNSTMKSGGGLYAFVPSSALQLHNVEVSDCFANVEGGGMLLNQVAANISGAGSFVTRNRARERGGGVATLHSSFSNGAVFSSLTGE
jgi:hypothetical protein